MLLQVGKVAGEKRRLVHRLVRIQPQMEYLSIDRGFGPKDIRLKMNLSFVQQHCTLRRPILIVPMVPISQRYAKVRRPQLVPGLCCRPSASIRQYSYTTIHSSLREGVQEYEGRHITALYYRGGARAGGMIEPRMSDSLTWFLEIYSRLGPIAVVPGRQGFDSSVTLRRRPTGSIVPMICDPFSLHRICSFHCCCRGLNRSVSSPVLSQFPSDKRS